MYASIEFLLFVFTGSCALISRSRARKNRIRNNRISENDIRRALKSAYKIDQRVQTVRNLKVKLIKDWKFN